jgi:Meiotically up-regulated gene 113
MTDNSAVKSRILNEVKRLAAENDGVALGKDRFRKATGIGEHVWLGKIWLKWSDVLNEAGVAQNTPFFRQAADMLTIFTKLRECTAHYNKFPTYAEMKFYKQIDPDMLSIESLQNRFNKSTLEQEFRNWLVEQPNLSAFEISLLNLIDANQDVEPTDPNKRISGHVYAALMGKKYKIGATSNLDQRLRQLNTTSPENIVYYHTIETDDIFGIEKYWHRRFDQYKLNREWFELPNLELAAFKKRKFQ